MLSMTEVTITLRNILPDISRILHLFQCITLALAIYIFHTGFQCLIFKQRSRIIDLCRVFRR